MGSTFRALSNHNYRLYAAGGLVSNTGIWMHRFSQDWLVLQLTGSGAVLGVTAGLQFLPMLLLAPVTGLIADRLPKRRLLQATQASMGLSALTLGLLAITGAIETWHVFVLAFVFGIGAAYDAPARHTIVSEMVGPDDISSAVGLNSAVLNGTRVIGPALGSMLIALLGRDVSATGAVMVISAVSLTTIIYALQRMRVDEFRSSPHVPRKGMIREGLRYLRYRGDLKLILAVSAIAGTLSFNFPLTFGLMATQAFDKGAEGFGILVSLMAAGSLLGALIVARRTSTTSRVVVLSAVALGLVEVLAGLMPSYLAFALWTPVLGLAAYALVTATNTAIQLGTAAEFRGRMMALYMLAWMGGLPLGSPIMGWVGETCGARWTLIGGGFAALAGGLIAAAVLALRASGQHAGMFGDERPATGA